MSKYPRLRLLAATCLASGVLVVAGEASAQTTTGTNASASANGGTADR